jgi:YHS domain-containing protein
MLWLVALAIAAQPPSAAQKSGAPPAIFVDAKGVAIGGYDVVSYFSGQAPRKGNPQWKAEYQGAQFLFATAENRRQFLADPRKYVPQFGGYCAWALTAGKLRKCDPRRFSIRDGRLFLFSAGSARERWERGDRDWIALASAKWREIFGGETSQP